MRSLLLAIIGALFLVMGLATLVTAFVEHGARSRPLDCEVFLEAPSERWVRLAGCTLDFDDAVLTDGRGAMERLSDRKAGISHTLYDAQPLWTAVVAPVKTPRTGARPARLAFSLADRELLAWVNRFERAGDDERAKLVKQQTYLDRLAMPGLLAGRVSRDANSTSIQQKLGPNAVGGMLLMRPEPLPQREVPSSTVVLGLIGAVLLAAAIRGLGRR